MGFTLPRTSRRVEFLAGRLCRVAACSSVDAKRRLFLIWQNPDTRQFVRVGRLTELVDGGSALAVPY
jgi:hypothetical protein